MFFKDKLGFLRTAQTLCLIACGVSFKIPKSVHTPPCGTKQIFHNPYVIHFAVTLATGLFNDGHIFIANVLQRMGYKIGEHAIDAMEKADKESIRKAKHEAKQDTKARRKKEK